MTGYLNGLADAIALIGGAIMLAGIAASLYRLIRVEWAAIQKIPVEHDQKIPVEHDRRTLRLHLGYYILLGLEFIVVADLLRTLIHPGLEELLVLGIVVVIRTIISVTLHWEMSHVPQVEERHP